MIWNWSAFLWGFTVGLGLVVAAILGLVLMLCFARTYAAIREEIAKHRKTPPTP